MRYNMVFNVLYGILCIENEAHILLFQQGYQGRAGPIEPANVAQVVAIFKKAFCKWVGTQDELDDYPTQF